MRAYLHLSLSMLLTLCFFTSCDAGEGPFIEPEPEDNICASLFLPVGGRCSAEWRSCNNDIENLVVQCTPADQNSFDCFCFKNGEPEREFRFAGVCPITNPTRNIVEFANDECAFNFEGPTE